MWITLSPCPATAHDPSAWGGLFRTRDGGKSWLALNSGSYVSGAIGLAISPTAPDHLLLATDSGVLSSKNGGRDWTVEAPDVLVGAAFAVVYDADGARALASGASAIFRSDGDRWRPTRAPAGAAPARALAPGSAPGRIYLAGWSGFHVSNDSGTSWVDASAGLPGDAIEAVVVDRGDPEVVYAVAGGRLWASTDGASHWRPRPSAAPSGRVEAVNLDDSEPGRLWVVVSGQLLRSDDRGERWRPVGRPLPDPRPEVRGLVVVGPIVFLATDRGLYRSPDSGERWEAQTENLPAHLEAGPLVRDPASPSTIYAGFSLTPYPALWRRAAEGGSSLSRLGVTNLVGGAAFLLLLLLVSVAAVRRLRASYYRMPLRTGSTSPSAPAGSASRR
jgi:photosystem II stability/assembly factor-like uncharacterized protein